MCVLKIIPVKRGEIYKRKQAAQITLVLKIIPVIWDGICKYKQPQKIVGAKNHTRNTGQDAQT